MNRNRSSRRPNRGGGRFNKRQPPNRGSYGGSTGLEPDLELQHDEDETDLMGMDLVGHNRNNPSTSNDKIPVRNKGKSKALVQRLLMSAENQEMVEDMLRDLQLPRSSQDYNNVSYNDTQMKSNEAYWQKYGDQRLVVESGVNFVAYGDCNEQAENCAEEFSYYAMNKLLRCGFEKNRCLEALRENDCDVGIALESLLCCCCALVSLGKENPSYSAERAQEAALQRQEEALALESIYDETFSEVITDRVWTIKLSLPSVLEAFQPKTIKVTNKEQSGNSKNKSCKGPENVCKYFLQGHCKFGDKCRLSHPLSVQSTSSCEMADKQETSERTVLNIDPFPFHLEVRFCRDSLYPFEPPMIVFYSTCELIPPSGCLIVTQRLCEEAKNLCESESPAIFCLISLLENENEIIECFYRPSSEFSLPEKKVVGNLSTPGKCEEYFDHDNNNPANRQKVIDMNSLDKKHRESSDEIGTQEINRKLKQQFHRLQSSPGYKLMLEQRKKLPAWKSQHEIIGTLQSHQIIVISGMTGCGKTTQIPQFILDHHLREEIGAECFIVCTQPRRISAMSVAERVSAERVEKIGGSVGYQVRLENKQSSGTRLLYCTTGILLRRLEGQSSLPGVSHVIVDEVHERTEESDFLMMVLKDLINVRADVRIILMSATLNAQLFSEYFYDAPVIYIPGQTFPVAEFFLEDSLEMTEFQVDPSSPYAKAMKYTSASPHLNPKIMKKGQMTKELQQIQDSADFRPPSDDMADQNLSEDQMAWRYYNFSKRTVTALCTMDHEKINYDLIVALLEWIVGEEHEYPKNGSILVFLPGMGEISTLLEQLQNTTTFSPKKSDRFWIIPLHSMLSSEEQSLVFKKPKDGVRKIVLSTNIAETSVTIDDVVFVIDSGKMKENRYDSMKGMESLEEVWVSQANARQRRGRAGRVTSGVCFHLFTRHQYEFKIADHQDPEIRRVPLEKLCLRIKVLGLFFGCDIKEVLGKLLEPPSEESINNSIYRLHNIGALDTEENLTSLGFHLAALPVDVRIAKLMLLGAIFRCLDPVLTIGAILSYKSPFSAPFDKREEADKKRQEMAVGNSDHLTLLRSYKGWLEAMERGIGAGYHYCRTNFVSMKTLQMIASLKCQYAELLSDIGFINANLTARKLARMAPRTGDGVLAATNEEMNVNSKNQKLVLGVVCAALFPNVVQVVKPDTKFKVSSAGAVPMDAKAAELKFWTKSDGQVFIHPKSVNFQVNYFDSPYLVYHEKVKTSKVYIRDSSMVSVYALLLFCGDCLSVNLEKGAFVVSIDDGWIRFTASSCQVATLVRDLRTELDRLLADKIENPSLDLRTCPRGSRIIDTIVRLIATQ